MDKVNFKKVIKYSKVFNEAGEEDVDFDFLKERYSLEVLQFIEKFSDAMSDEPLEEMEIPLSSEDYCYVSDDYKRLIEGKSFNKIVQLLEAAFFLEISELEMFIYAFLLNYVKKTDKNKAYKFFEVEQGTEDLNIRSFFVNLKFLQ